MSFYIPNMRFIYRRLMHYNRFYLHRDLSFSNFEICRTFHVTGCKFTEEHESKDVEWDNDLDFYGVHELHDPAYETEQPDSTKAEQFQNVQLSDVEVAPKPKLNYLEENLPYGSIRYDNPSPNSRTVHESKVLADEIERERIAKRKTDKAAKKAEKKIRKLLQSSKSPLKAGFGRENLGSNSEVHSYLEGLYFGNEQKNNSVADKEAHKENEDLTDRKGEKGKNTMLNDEQVYTIGIQNTAETKHLNEEDDNFIDSQYFGVDKQSLINETAESKQTQKGGKINSEHAVSGLSFIDEQYFDRDCDVVINESEPSDKLVEDFAQSSQAKKELSYIDEQYFECNDLDGDKQNEDVTLPMTREELQKENVKQNHKSKSSSMQYLTDSLPQVSSGKDKDKNTKEMDDNNVPTHKEKPKSKKMAATKDEENDLQSMYSVNSEAMQTQSDKDKILNFENKKSPLEIGNRKVRKYQRKVYQIEDTENAYSVTRKLREEYERKEKIDVYGRANPKHFDSQGFRILSGQTPNFKNVPSIDIIKYLRQNVMFNGHDIVAISKPYGLSLQGGSGKDLCIDQFLGDIIPFCTLHSIDTMETEATGIMLFGKTEEMKEKLTEKLENGEVCKRFLTITKNVPKLLQGEIDIPIVEGTVEGKHRMALRPHRTTELAAFMPRQQSGKEAITRYRVLDSKDTHYALVECIPVTSVKHQLRVHLAFGLNCPILGDHKYSHVNKLAPMNLHPSMLQRLKIQQSKVRHLALHLHCRSIVIPNFLDGRNLFVSAPFPVHFLANMRDLKLKLPPNV